jgi:MurNAc alpha-1-phosphate uridylyltransferase
MIKTAMILAAGRGERMRPLTATTAKVLLPVQGQPLIHHHLHALREAGITQVIINHAYLGDQITASIGSGSQFGLNVVYSPEPIERGLETGGGIFNALPLLGKDPFIVIGGDVWTEFPYASLPSQLSGLAHLIMVPNPDFHPNGDYALIDGKISFAPTPRYCFSSISVLTPELFKTCHPGFFPLRDPLNAAIQNHQVTGDLFTGRWHNFNTPEGYYAVVEGGGI